MGSWKGKKKRRQESNESEFLLRTAADAQRTIEHSKKISEKESYKKNNNNKWERERNGRNREGKNGITEKTLTDSLKLKRFSHNNYYHSYIICNHLNRSKKSMSRWSHQQDKLLQLVLLLSQPWSIEVSTHLSSFSVFWVLVWFCCWGIHWYTLHSSYLRFFNEKSVIEIH